MIIIAEAYYSNLAVTAADVVSIPPLVDSANEEVVVSVILRTRIDVQMRV